MNFTLISTLCSVQVIMDSILGFYIFCVKITGHGSYNAQSLADQLHCMVTIFDDFYNIHVAIH